MVNRRVSSGPFYTRLVMAYHKDDIERVRQATNLVELIGATTTVKRTGRSFKAICPFHQEKTPSLSVDPAKGVYYCFGCGVSGDMFTFVQETQGLDFAESVEVLASAAGITLRKDPQAARRRGERQDLVDAISTAVDFYLDRLKSGPDAGGARAYLRGRGYGADIVDHFRIGYSPPEWDTLINHLKSGGIKERALLGAGLATRSSRGRLIDYFRGRIMFPIYDLRGDPVGFGARKLEGEGPKYLNSPETRLYQKAKLLYGLNWAKADITRRGLSLVVEGYTDVIALHMAGWPVAVATCGTALGEDHFDLLRRFADRVVLAFDADEAGAGAAIRSDELELPSTLELDLRVALMPDGRDPADMVQDGDTDLLDKAVDNSEPLMQFRIDREIDRYQLDEPEGRARAVRTVAPLVARQQDAVARREYAGLIARRTGVDRDVVQQAIDEAVRPRRRASPPSPQEFVASTGPDRAEQQLIRLAMAGDEGARSADSSLLVDATHRSAFESLPTSDIGPTDLGSLLGDRDDPQARLLRRLAVSDEPLPAADELIERLDRALKDRRISELRRQLELIDPSDDPDTYSTTFNELIALERQKRHG